MAWTEISTGAIDIKKSATKEYEGTYTGFKEMETKLGKQVVWNFHDESDSFSIYGFTNLNRAMESVQVGTLVKITYKGTQKVQTKYGLKDVHQVSVQSWQPDTQEDKTHSEYKTPF